MSKQFAEFRVGDLFEVDLGANINSGLIKSNGKYPVVTGVTIDNGINGYFDDEEKSKFRGKFYNYALTISCRGEKSGTVFFHPYEFILGNNAILLKVKGVDRPGERAMLYLSTLINKLPYTGYSNYPTKASIQEDTITLPVTDASANTDSPEPDWEYMEDYIREIEEKYLDSVEKYNRKNEEILDVLHPDYPGEAPEAYDYAEFKVGGLFDIITGSMVKSLQEGNTPRINPTEQSNGIGSWTESDNDLARYFEDFVSVSFLGNVFYQKQRSSLEMKVHGLKRKDGFLGYRKGTYIATAVSKAVSNVFDYGMQLSSQKLKEVTITLPITPTGDPDWEYMEEYINFIEGGGREIANYVQHKRRAS